MQTLSAFLRTVNSNRPLLMQLVFTVLAFFIMVVLSYLFTSNIVRCILVRDSESLLDFEKDKIEKTLALPEAILFGFSETVRHMIIRGDDLDTIRKYVEDLSVVLGAKDGLGVGFDGIFGYFETLDGESAYLFGKDRAPSDDFDVKTRPWYSAAIETEDDTTLHLIYRTSITKRPVYAYTRSIFSNDHRRLGVACLTVAMDSVGSDIVEAANSQNAVGMLISNDLTIVAHTNPDFLAKKLNDPEIPISAVFEAIKEGVELSDKEILNFRDESSIGFSRKLNNGWYLALVTPQKQYFQSVTNMALFLFALGTVLASVLIGFLVSIDTARNKANTESKTKSSFLANMSHEIRTPMNAIVGMTTLGKSAANMERKDFCFKKIEEASQHLLGVINNILDISKIEAQKFELSLAEFHFERMLQNVVDIISHRVDEMRQKLMVYIDSRIPPLLVGDDQRIAQVVTNLLGNAVKFTPVGGSITLEASLLKEESGIYTVQITVTDTGIGISGEQQARLFHAFQQAESSTTRQFGGTGLGLVISKNIVEMMGGTIEVRSEQGKGTTFAFTVQVHQSEDQDSTFLNQNIHWGNVSIMVIDDDQDILDYFRNVIERFGTTCETASSASDAIKLIEQHGAFHIYFVDWKMPETDGVALTKILKAKAPNPDQVAVIMISAAEWREIEDEAKKAGVDLFLAKPLFPSVIADTINKVLGVSRRPTEKKTQEVIAGQFAGRRILLAEDVKINSIILQGLLEPTDLEIRCAENGEIAVRMFQENPEKYDLIFMDVQMPVMNGYEATRQIRSLNFPRAKTIPIIAMTANVFREDVEKCLECGMNSHLGKPLDFDAVLEKLYTYLPGVTAHEKK